MLMQLPASIFLRGDRKKRVFLLKLSVVILSPLYKGKIKYFYRQKEKFL